ncbi:MAG: amidase [Proteobacteria bacterium]|nr:amidase [Pseudomonadota bacterium]
MREYESYDALGLAELVKSGETSADELLEAAIERLEERNPRLGAVVIPMLEQARAAVREGLPDGPFHGVPFLLKDLHAHYAGVATTNGCALFRDFVPDHDAELTARYKRAGLVVFGKTASPEFGITTTTESTLFGVTHNPWSPDHTAGGSSGGAASAVAGGILPAANASDGGGSIRIPASCCGLFGMKPTRARTPLGPDVGEGWAGMSTAHAVTRSVRDSAALLDVTQGPDLGAPYWAPPLERPYLEEVGAPAGRLRVAVQTRSFNGVETHPDCVAAVEDAARLCAELGHDVEEAELAVDAETLGNATRVIIFANLIATLEDRTEALGRELGPNDIEPMTQRMVKLAENVRASEYARSVRIVHGVGRQVAVFLQRYDVLVTPTMAAPPLLLGTLALTNPDTKDYVTSVLKTTGFTQLFNVSGNPAMSVPLAWNEQGLPVGVQFAGRFGDEATLFRLAAQLEEAQPWFDRRPPSLRA